ncbi:glycosyltransferase family 4 protein [Lichenifustis flavocetrariae]|uniref:Glycosyltransferase family 4 protein n=1 Tax=Lichenifustis flavocetrariae TaxID=2949735 RepID=A0AA41Z8K9_9HYPH|nr:glycosyltransferase family 4 protein [Lichenifustis flavocetrariae]MCW6511337.1 glycosyltransferase family 4 protein [Lichenifustis flavocetrariae]
MSAAAALRVLFIVPHPIEGPSSRFRVYQFQPYLEAHGIEVTVRPLVPSRAAMRLYEPGGLVAKAAITTIAAAERLGDILRAGQFDVVYLLREAFPFGPPWIEHALKRRAGRLIFDFDDAIYLRSLVYRNPLDRFRDFGKTEAIIRLADHVVVGSRHLQEFASRFTRQDNITIVPTVVDTDVFRPADHLQLGTLTIGWIGTPRGSSYLRGLLGAMRHLCRRFNHLRFVFIGAEPFGVGDLPVTFQPWRMATEVADIQAFDIGLMPLTDDEETRGKCGFKLIEYMSLGIPTVSSPVGANCDIVEDGRSGLFATSEAEWIAAIGELIERPDLRRTLAENGRRRVVASYSLASAAPQLLRLITAAALRAGSVPSR